MDPLTALSLSCNILDLVEKAIKCGRLVKEMHDSGSSKDHDGLEKTAGLIESVVADLSPLTNPRSRPRFARTTTDLHMERAVSTCSTLCISLRDILQKCRPTDTASWRSASAAALRTVASRSEIERLQKELMNSQSTLITLIVTSTRGDIGNIMRLLEELGLKASQTSHVLEEIKKSLEQGGRDTQGQLRAARDSLQEADEEMKHACILRQLSFPAMDARFRDVHGAEDETFRWILDDPNRILEEHPYPQTTFPDWLRSGEGVFHIVGKAGSGKSTLVKFLCEHGETEDLLQEWAQMENKRLVLCKFFFWRVTSVAEQKTLRGLIRSLLHDILVEVPALTARLFPKQWARRIKVYDQAKYGYEVRDRDITTAFSTLMQESRIFDEFGIRICFFIDGLDEFEQSIKLQRETQHDLAKKLYQWTEKSGGRVKMCVTSRPLPEFTKVFPASQQFILQNFTRGDIQTIVSHGLEETDCFLDMKQRSSDHAVRCRALTRKIVEEANGVFLWVVLVVNQLKQALAAGDPLEVLERILDTSNRDLDGFFEDILHSIPEHHRQVSYYLLAAVMMLAGFPISNRHNPQQWNKRPTSQTGSNGVYLSLTDCALIYTCADANPDRFFAFDKKLAWLPEGLGPNELTPARTRELLATRCRGLIESNDDQHLIFIHRAIPEAAQSLFSRQESSRARIDQHKVAEMLTWVVLADVRAMRASSVSQAWHRVRYLLGRLRAYSLAGLSGLFHLLYEIGQVLEDTSRARTGWGVIQRKTHLHTNDLDMIRACQSFYLHEFVSWVLDEVLTLPTDADRMLDILSDAVFDMYVHHRPVLRSNEIVIDKLLERGLTLGALQGRFNGGEAGQGNKGTYIWYEFATRELLFQATFYGWRRIYNTIPSTGFHWGGVQNLLRFGADAEIYFNESANGSTGFITGPGGQVLYEVSEEDFDFLEEPVLVVLPKSPISLRELVLHHSPPNAKEILELIDIDLRKKREVPLGELEHRGVVHRTKTA